MPINNYGVPEGFPEDWKSLAATRTGEFERDIHLGTVFALISMQRAKMQEDSTSLAAVLTDIINCGEFGPLEAGFVAKVASAARAGAMD